MVSVNDTDQLLRTVFCSRCRTVSEVQTFADREAVWHQEEIQRANAARARFESRKQRLIREEQQRLAKLAERSTAASETAALPEHIRLAMQRARQKRTSDL
jgi:Na+-translocating ferredoxin:NAD+ oxidoreductase RnfC subunit